MKNQGYTNIYNEMIAAGKAMDQQFDGATFGYWSKLKKEAKKVREAIRGVDFEAALFAATRLTILPKFTGRSLPEIIAASPNYTTCMDLIAIEIGFKNQHEMAKYRNNWHREEIGPIYIRPWIFPNPDLINEYEISADCPRIPPEI